MSQHVVEDDKVKWMFGWDQPLMSFYLQKHEKNLDSDENPVLWLGALPNTQMYEVSDLTIAAKKHGLKIPYRTQVVLYGDKDEGR